MSTIQFKGMSPEESDAKMNRIEQNLVDIYGKEEVMKWKAAARESGKRMTQALKPDGKPTTS